MGREALFTRMHAFMPCVARHEPPCGPPRSRREEPPRGPPARRRLSRAQFGDGDGRELSVYMFLEDLLPVRIPKLYFCDLSRETTNYVLITECIPYGEGCDTPPASPASPGLILPKCGKYQDDRLPNAHEYYFALMRGFARIAAADKRGRYDEAASCFDGGVYGGGKPPADTAARRDFMARHAASNFDSLIEFATVVAPRLFPPALSDPAFLRRAKDECAQCARYFTALGAATSRSADHVALTHVNLQIDNGFFWRDEGGEIQARPPRDRRATAV